MAIYSVLHKKEISKIADEFALGDLTSYSGIKNGSVNTLYLIETKRGRYLAKIDEVKSEIEVKQELDLLFHLRKQGFPCPQPLKSKTGGYYLDLQGKCLTVSRYLDGSELPVHSITTSQLETLGHALADLHLIGRSYKKGIDNRFSFNRIASVYRDVRRQMPSHLKHIIRVFLS
jgi:homoserine kinase type II